MKNNKKGFTIVELVIVIAVIAILASVLVPSFASLITKAKQSADTQVVRLLNKAVRADLASKGETKHTTMHDAVEACKDQGLSPDKISAKSTLCIAWSKNTGDFVLIDKLEKEVIFPLEDGKLETKSVEGEEINYFIVTTYDDKIDDLDENNNSEYLYSVYAYGNDWPSEITVRTGFDAGDNTNIQKINYISESSNPSNILIKTNSFDTKLSIDAPLDTVNHYGYCGYVNIKAVEKTNCYNEFGVVGIIETTKGSVNIQDNAVVYQIAQLNTNNTFINVSIKAKVYDILGIEQNGICSSEIYTFEEVDRHECSHEKADVISDGVKVFEVCRKCGCSLIRVQENDGIITKYVVNDSNDEYVIMPKTLYLFSQVEKVEDSLAVVYLCENSQPIEMINNTGIIDNSCENHNFVKYSTATDIHDAKDACKRYTIDYYQCSNCSSEYETRTAYYEHIWDSKTHTCVNSKSECEHYATEDGREADAYYSVCGDTLAIWKGSRPKLVYSSYNYRDSAYYCLTDGKEILAEAKKENPNISKVVIDDSFIYIDSEAFMDCDEIKELYISDQVSYIYKDAFNGCDGLEKVSFIGNSTSGSVYLSDSCFKDCVNLKTVEFPENLRNIGYNAFENCVSLEGEITIPEKVYEIGNYAFSNCTSLTGVVINGGTGSSDSVKAYIFKDCTNLKYVIFNKEGEYCKTGGGLGTFQGCTSLEYVKFNGVLHGVIFNWFQNCYSLEEVEADRIVGNICEYGFENCYKLKHIDLSECNIIGKYAFSNCYSLEGDLEIATNFQFSSVNRIERYAFNNCYKIKSVTVGTSIEAIQENVFENCTALEKLVLPANASSYYKQSTYASYDLVAVNCPNITTLKILENPEYAENNVYSSKDENGNECNVFMYGNTLMKACNTSIIPSNTKSISYNSYKEYSAFTDAPELESFTLPAGITKFNAGIFKNNAKLKNINVAEGNESYLPTTGAYKDINCIVSADKKTLICGCANTVFIDTIERIGSNAFSYRSEVKNIEIPSTVKTIDTSAFESCLDLEEVTISSGVESIGTYAFKNCEKLSKITFNNSKIKTIPSGFVSGCKSLVNITIPNGVTRLDYSSFENCESLETIEIPTTVTSIGNYAFEKCSSLKNFEIPSSVLSIGSYAFAYCTSLTEMVIPSTVTTIGDNYGMAGLFNGCTALTRVEINAKVTSISTSLFKGLTSLKEVVLPADITSIPSNAFTNCKSIETIDIPDKVTSISINAFLNCESLTHVNLPSSVQTIGNKAFRNCTNLKEVTVPATINSISPTAFTNCNNIEHFNYVSNGGLVVNSANSGLDFETISVILGMKSYNCIVNKNNTTYQPIDYLKNIIVPDTISSLNNIVFEGCELIETIELPNTIKEIPDNAFTGCTGLKEIILSEEITEIGEEAFLGCEKLENIALPLACEFIGARAFKDCKSIKSIAIPSTIIDIGEGLFENCESLSTVYFNSTFELITDRMFYNCKNLTSVHLPNSIREIGSLAFYNCVSLTSIDIPDSVETIARNAFKNCINLVL